MGKVRWASGLGAVAMAVVLLGVRPAAGDVASDRAAAIVKYPLVEVDGDKKDTVIQLSNASRDPVNVHCFYIDANKHCTNDGSICTEASDCCGSEGCGICQQGCNETDFFVHLTPRQPLGWLASTGMQGFPIDGIRRRGVAGSSNAGSRIPAVAEDPFIGELKCIAVDDNGDPVDWNVLKGEASIERLEMNVVFNVAKYNAVGIQAIEGAVNDDHELVLGGPDAEYNGCPSVIILNHFFEGVTDPGSAASSSSIDTRLILVPCTENIRAQIPTTTVVQYLVFNEFEQRFSTSRTVECQQSLYLSHIDTSQPDRSIFSAGVAGTVTGQTRLSPLDSGLLAVAVEEHSGGHMISAAAFNVHFQGDRPDPDIITLP